MQHSGNHVPTFLRPAYIYQKRIQILSFGIWCIVFVLFFLYERCVYMISKLLFLFAFYTEVQLFLRQKLVGAISASFASSKWGKPHQKTPYWLKNGRRGRVRSFLIYSSRIIKLVTVATGAT